jgi:membrane protein implicated in regulation of membrane protease activity
MTNEQIYKYADKKLSKQEARFNSIFVGTFVLFWIGYKMALVAFIFAGFTLWYWLALVCIMVSLAIYLVCLNKYANRYNEIRRNYIYNLVRADERKRCMTKMERYEHEGSK